jgi:hypothetical protein
MRNFMRTGNQWLRAREALNVSAFLEIFTTRSGHHLTALSIQLDVAARKIRWSSG